MSKPTDSTTCPAGNLGVFERSEKTLALLQGLVEPTEAGARLKNALSAWHENGYAYFVLLGFRSAILYAAVPDLDALPEALVRLAMRARETGYDNLDMVEVYAAEVTRDIVRPLWEEVARQTAEEASLLDGDAFEVCARPAGSALH